jgi:hypothetical protein
MFTIKPIHALALALAITLSACGSKEPEQTASAVPPKTPQQQRIDSIQAADAIGYDGKMARDAVQRTVEQSEARQKEAMEAAGGEQGGE